MNLLKKQLGQFNTTNAAHILQGFESKIVDKTILDPFCGNQDLLLWAMNNGAQKVSGLDIDTKLIDNQISFYNDSLKAIPECSFILTNPPYLAKNKMTPKQKLTYNFVNCDDFYLLAIQNIIRSQCQEGILIIPINFFSAENSDKIRGEFLNIYQIKNVNYFTNSVFEDTTYNIVSFYFEKKEEELTFQEVIFNIVNEKKQVVCILEKEFNYKIAGREMANITQHYNNKIKRITQKWMEDRKGDVPIDVFFNDKKTNKQYYVTPETSNILNNNIILLNCIDTNASEDGWIKAEDVRAYKKYCLVGKESSRNIASIILNPARSIEEQEKIINLFNSKLSNLRKEFLSLFLTNFRDNNRKRISFDFCYALIEYCAAQLNR